MLKFTLDSLVPAGAWHWNGTRWHNGLSWVEPYTHAVLEQTAVTHDGALLIVTRERRRGSQEALFVAPPEIREINHATYERLRKETLAWPLEFVVLEVHANGDVQIMTGCLGTAPVYLFAEEPALHGSWDLLDLRHLTSATALVSREVTRRLTRHYRYTTETAWHGLQRLTERATASFGRHGLTISHPDIALHSRPRSLASGADVLGGYETVLEHVVSQRHFDPGTTAVELSGGMDSANVALTLGKLHPGELTSCALMLGGTPGPQQIRRRRPLVERCGFDDILVPILEFLPLAPNGPRLAHQVSPYEEPYVEGYFQMLAELAERGIDTVFTGIGGDEMVSLTVDEKPPSNLQEAPHHPRWISEQAINHLREVNAGVLPAAVVSEMTLVAHACIAPGYLRAGIWPISPLASPELILFGEWLPLEWRRNKHLHRARLSSLGFSDEIANPPIREDFAHVIQQGMRQNGLPLIERYLNDSLLVDTGYVAPAGLRACYSEALTADPMDTAIYEFINWEIGLRTFDAA